MVREAAGRSPRPRDWLPYVRKDKSYKLPSSVPHPSSLLPVQWGSFLPTPYAESVLLVGIHYYPAILYLKKKKNFFFGGKCHTSNA